MEDEGYVSKVGTQTRRCAVSRVMRASPMMHSHFLFLVRERAGRHFQKGPFITQPLGQKWGG